MFGRVSDDVWKVVNYLVRPTDLEGTARLEANAGHTGKEVRAVRFILEDLEREDKRCVRGHGYGLFRYSVVEIFAPCWHYADADVAGFDVLGAMRRVAAVLAAREGFFERDHLLQETGLPAKHLDFTAQILGARKLIQLHQPLVRGFAFSSAMATAQTYTFLN